MSNQNWRAPACTLVVALATAFALPAAAADSEQDVRAEMQKLPWQVGPAKGDVGSRSKLDIPDGARLLPESSGSRFLELTGNLPEPGDTVLIRKGWWATLSFEDSGFVKEREGRLEQRRSIGQREVNAIHVFPLNRHRTTSSRSLGFVPVALPPRRLTGRSRRRA